MNICRMYRGINRLVNLQLGAAGGWSLQPDGRSRGDGIPSTLGRF